MSLNLNKGKVMSQNTTYLCSKCDSIYGDCIHTDNYQTLPKDENGKIISKEKFQRLMENFSI